MNHSTTNSKTWQEEEIELLELLSKATKLEKLSKRLNKFKPTFKKKDKV